MQTIGASIDLARVDQGCVFHADEKIGPHPQAASAATRLDALERYMRAKLCAPVALADLAHAAGTSVRSLNILCNRHHGVSPMELLRNLRLDAAHAQLAARPETSVAELALTFGFGHPGRFAGYYKLRFGQLPKHGGHSGNRSRNPGRSRRIFCPTWPVLRRQYQRQVL